MTEPFFRVAVHPVSRHGVRARLTVRHGDGGWIFLGELIMATAEWEAYRAALAPEIEVYHAPPIIGGYGRKAA